MRRASAFCLFLLLASPLAAHEASQEVLRYRWHLKGVRGALAGLFLPNHGEGSLVTSREAGGNLTSELLITAQARSRDEFWRYGAELDPEAGRTLRAWSSYLFRGERKSKETELRQDDVVDVASGIYLLRQDPPAARRRMRIWSDGKVYPVVVVPGGRTTRRLNGRSVPGRHYSIVGLEEPGERRWNGRMELWLAEDEAATPVEILIERSWAGVKLELAS
jgi:hypothetical protein